MSADGDGLVPSCPPGQGQSSMPTLTDRTVRARKRTCSAAFQWPGTGYPQVIPPPNPALCRLRPTAQTPRR